MISTGKITGRAELIEKVELSSPEPVQIVLSARIQSGGRRPIEGETTGVRCMNYENPSEGFVLFNSYWWLIIVVLGMGFGLAKTWLAHKRANRGLDILKSYVDQGKEPPPELMQYLRRPAGNRQGGPGSSIFLTILFAGMAAAFTWVAINEGDRDVYFVVIIMAALALGFLAKALVSTKQNHLDRQ